MEEQKKEKKKSSGLKILIIILIILFVLGAAGYFTFRWVASNIAGELVGFVTEKQESFQRMREGDVEAFFEFLNVEDDEIMEFIGMTSGEAQRFAQMTEKEQEEYLEETFGFLLKDDELIIDLPKEVPGPDTIVPLPEQAVRFQVNELRDEEEYLVLYVVEDSLDSITEFYKAELEDWPEQVEYLEEENIFERAKDLDNYFSLELDNYLGQEDMVQITIQGKVF